ncbi:Major histocompatibility complex class I-related gene protein [Varanus komodoensis]|nr:Major histocompatibility complex class I-related gene protein [Varanus komodoensis]
MALVPVNIVPAVFSPALPIRNVYFSSTGERGAERERGRTREGEGSILSRRTASGAAGERGFDGPGLFWDFLSLDKETLRWTAADATAQLTKRKWEKNPAIAQGFKAYLEDTCIEWLRRYLEYGKETLQRTEPPEVKVTRHESPVEDMETLVCRAHGFYPKEIDATWTKDGQSWQHATFRRRVVPNADGTYYISLYTDIDPKERGLYRCRVAHAGLSQPLALAWEGPAGERRLGGEKGQVGCWKLCFP